MSANKNRTALTVTTKTGFFALSDLKVFDRNGRPFYATTKGRCFNLPIGNYTITGKAEQLNAPLEQDVPFYPFERNDRNYSRVEIHWCKNPNKASVVFENNVAHLFIDESFKNIPLPCFLYLCAHELAHAHYKLQDGEKPEEVENRCDNWAEHTLLEKGFNPSQIQEANHFLLKSNWRKHNCTDRMKENFSKK